MRIGIDLGSATVRVAVSGKGVVYSEPAVIADCGRLPLARAVGEPARLVLGRTPANIQAIQPVRRGVVGAPLATRDMLQRVLKQVPGLRWRRPKAAVAVPSRATVLEREALSEACRAAGTGRVSLIPLPVAAALGCDAGVSPTHPVTILNLGAGLTEVAVVADDVLLGDTISVGSEDFDRAIAAHLRLTHNLEIGLDAAEELKLEIGTAHPDGDGQRARVVGREMSSGLPAQVEVSGRDIREAIAGPLQRIASLGRALLDVSPPALAGPILERGIILTGGGALLSGLDRYLEERLGVPVQLADDPCGCAARGAIIAAENRWSEV